MNETAPDHSNGNHVIQNALSRRAAALAEVHGMQLDLDACNNRITELNRECERLHDEVTLLIADRNAFRDEARLCHSKLVEICTVQTNIGLMCAAAQDVMKGVREALGGSGRDDGDLLQGLADHLAVSDAADREPAEG